MTLLTGYAVYFSGGRSGAAPGDGVSGGTLVLDFDPKFGTQKSRGVVSFPELGKRDGGFYAVEGVTYFVPDNPIGLPIDYEGRILVVSCSLGGNAPSVPDAVVEDAPVAKTEPPKRANPALKREKPNNKQPKLDLDKTIYFDIPDGTDYLAQTKKPKTPQDKAPDISLSASLRSAFSEPDDTDDEPRENSLEIASDSAVTEQLPSPELVELVEKAPEVIEKRAEIEAYFAPESRALTEPVPTALMKAEEDDWAVYLSPQPTIEPARPAPAHVIEIITEVPAPAQTTARAHQTEAAFDPVIDLVLSDDERETFSLMAQEVVETIETFDALKQSKKQGAEEPMLAAELRKLDPNPPSSANPPDKHPRKLLPWIKRDETEAEMLERLTIKSQRFAV